ncbi:hypothetical protein BSM4216_2670 [Bacillus smithii]|nr:hypothetical protein BSM4216_2670 [Bacillus smithii]
MYSSASTVGGKGFLEDEMKDEWKAFGLSAFSCQSIFASFQFI